jgi:DNA-binding LytR/AlgR family response regulator
LKPKLRSRKLHRWLLKFKKRQLKDTKISLKEKLKNGCKRKSNLKKRKWLLNRHRIKQIKQQKMSNLKKRLSNKKLKKELPLTKKKLSKLKQKLKQVP